MCALLTKGHALPVLSLVFAEVEDLEGLAALDFEEALAGCMDGEATEIAADPAAAEFLSDG